MNETLTLGLALAMLTLGLPAIAGTTLAAEDENAREDIDLSDAELVDRETIHVPDGHALQAHLDLDADELTLATTPQSSPADLLPGPLAMQAAVGPDDANCLTTEENGWLNTASAYNVHAADLPAVAQDSVESCEERNDLETAPAEITMTTVAQEFTNFWAISWDFDAFGYFIVSCDGPGASTGDAGAPTNSTTCEYIADGASPSEWSLWEGEIVRDGEDTGFTQVRAN